MWQQITLQFNECMPNGKGPRLESAFGALLISRGGKPWTAALFSRTSPDYNHVFYYLSPDAMQFAATLAESYGAVPCEQPEKPSIEVSGTRLAVGDVRSLELLWPRTT
jgi:hypothetical protein